MGPLDWSWPEVVEASEPDVTVDEGVPPVVAGVRVTPMLPHSSLVLRVRPHRTGLVEDEPPSQEECFIFRLSRWSCRSVECPVPLGWSFPCFTQISSLPKRTGELGFGRGRGEEETGGDAG